MERIILKDLIEWKEMTRDRKPLLDMEPGRSERHTFCKSLAGIIIKTVFTLTLKGCLS